jgi:hypothetical protein
MGSAVIRSLLILDPVRVAELVGHDVAQLGVIGPDGCGVDRYEAWSARRQGCRSPACVLRV